MTTSELLRFADSLAGQTLTTQARDVPFAVERSGSGLVYTLAETERTRPEPVSALEKVLARYQETISLRPADYQDVTFNASYTLALLGRFVAAQQRP